MSITKTDAIHAVIGSVVFWLPNTILHTLRGPDASFLHWRLLASLQTFATLATLIAIWVLRDRDTNPRRVALCMLLGIWVLGPLWLSINATLTGGGFAREQGWLGVVVAVFLFPVMTPLLSVYDGSILSVLISTLFLALACVDLRAIRTKWRTPTP